MPRRFVPLLSGECYHVYNRGNNRENVFFDQESYSRFLYRLRKYLLAHGEEQPSSYGQGPRAEIIAYCLMPNHFHLLVRPLDDRFSRHMQRLGISYSMATNVRLGRVGSIFQGTFKAVHVNRDPYLLHLSRYIHLNPVEAGLVSRPEDWEFSSYRDYLGLRRGGFCSPSLVLGQFRDCDAYQTFVNEEWSGHREDITDLLLDDNQVRNSPSSELG